MQKREYQMVINIDIMSGSEELQRKGGFHKTFHGVGMSEEIEKDLELIINALERAIIRINNKGREKSKSRT